MKKILISIISICFIISSLLFVNFFINNKKTIYSYNINQLIDYKANLFDNSFIDQDSLKENEMYITDLIKNIDINFNYNLDSSKKIDLNYSYEIIGTIVSKYINDQKIVWTKKYQLLDKKSSKNKNINIKEHINIDFLKYLEEVNEFKKNFTLSTDNVLNIEFIIHIEGRIDNEKIIDDKISSLSIPLGVQAFSITEDYLDKDYKNIIVKNSNLFYPFIPLIIIVIILVIFYKKIFNIKSKYEKKLNKILRNYNDVIIEIETKIDFFNYNTIKVKNIKEMVDLEQELQIPINLYKENNRATFTLLNNNILYIYILEE